MSLRPWGVGLATTGAATNGTRATRGSATGAATTGAAATGAAATRGFAAGAGTTGAAATGAAATRGFATGAGTTGAAATGVLTTSTPAPRGFAPGAATTGPAARRWVGSRRWVDAGGATAMIAVLARSTRAMTAVLRAILPNRLALVAISQRRAGSSSIIASMAGARTPACVIGRGRSVAMARSRAIGLLLGS